MCACLCSQLLADVAALERPDLQAKKEELVVSIAEGRNTIQNLEDTILRLLAESSGNILDDEQLINTLDDSKKISKKTEESVAGAEVTTKEINVTCEAYRPVATRGSILYFVVADFGTIDPMVRGCPALMCARAWPVMTWDFILRTPLLKSPTV